MIHGMSTKLVNWWANACQNGKDKCANRISTIAIAAAVIVNRNTQATHARMATDSYANVDQYFRTNIRVCTVTDMLVPNRLLTIVNSHLGKCEDRVGSFECVCEEGRTGVRCEKEMETCTIQKPWNDAACIGLFQGYFCVCPSGIGCQHEFDACEADRCKSKI